MPRRTAVAPDGDGQHPARAAHSPIAAAAAQTPSGDPLLAAKFEIPAAPGTLVRRRRLEDRLTDAVASPLTLITGAAGAGKTTLAATWAVTGRAPGPVVWLTTERDDNAPGAFWAYVIGAFRNHGVALPDVPPPLPGEGVGHSTLVRLAWALTRLPRPVVLVLDGFEQLPDREIADGLDFVLGHARSRLRLIVTGRAEPLLPLHRYRTQGRIAEIRGADLAFTSGETRRLLGRHGLEPSEESTCELTARTEGWAAGLRLCALAMRRSDDPDGFARSFAASRQAVADYLLAEFLHAHPEETQDLLVRTSILARLHPALADELTGRSDADGILASLAHRNSLVEPIADSADYHCHPLFAEVLRSHLRIRHPGLEPRLHRRAARWYADRGRLTEALRHAGAAGEWGFAAGLVVDRLAIGRLLTGGDDDRLIRVFDAMPGDLPDAAPALVAAACALARHDRPSCLAQLERAQPLLEAGSGSAPSAAARAANALLRLLSGSASSTPEASARQTAGLLARVPAPLLREHPEAESLRLHGLAAQLLDADRAEEAAAALDAAARSCTTPVTDGLRRDCRARLALTESLTGNLRRAEEHALRASAADTGRGTPARRGAAELALAQLATERADFTEARRRLLTAQEDTAVRLDPFLSVESAVTGSRLDLHDGNPQHALSVLDHAADGNGKSGAEPSPRALRRLAAARSAVHLARGDHERALDVLETPAHPGGELAVALARAHCAAGDADRARQVLSASGRDGEAGLARHVRSRLVRARAALLDGDRAAADGCVAQALAAARPELLRLPFVDEGPWLRQVLERRTDLARAHGWLFPEQDGLPRAGLAPAPVEPLTERERDVLRCAARVLSTAEIAEELGLSVNTVKTHFRGVFRKLSVSRRGEAVRLADRLGML